MRMMMMMMMMMIAMMMVSLGFCEKRVVLAVHQKAAAATYWVAPQAGSVFVGPSVDAAGSRSLSGSELVGCAELWVRKLWPLRGPLPGVAALGAGPSVGASVVPASVGPSAGKSWSSLKIRE